MTTSSANNPQYFEGTLQLRSYTKEVLRFVREEVAKADKVHIAKEKPQGKNNLDLYFSSNKFLRRLGKKLSGKFCGELKESATLHTRDHQRSRDLYRMTVMFRCLPFKRGDTVVVRGEEVEVLNVGTRVQVKILETGKKKHVAFSDIRV